MQNSKKWKNEKNKTLLHKTKAETSKMTSVEEAQVRKEGRRENICGKHKKINLIDSWASKKPLKWLDLFQKGDFISKMASL